MRINAALLSIAFLAEPAPATRLAAQEPPPSDTAWRYLSPDKIEWFCLCATDKVLVATKNLVAALDAGSGGQLWQLDGVPSLAEGLFPGSSDSVAGFSYKEQRIVGFDMASGRHLWAQDSLPASERILGYFRLGNRDLLLLFRQSAAPTPTVTAIRLSTGEVLWQRSDLFSQKPKFGGQGGFSDLTVYQTLLIDSDTTLILYVTQDGPMRLDARSGATLWRGEALKGRKVPSVYDHEPYAPMLIADSILVIPSGKHLVGLDVRDGHLVWEQAAEYPKRPASLARRPAGLLVKAGSSYVTVLDPTTGAARWAAPLTVESNGAAYEVTQDHYYVVSGDRLLSALLTTGDTTGLATVAFEGGEHPVYLTVIGGRLVMASRQNIAVADSDGHLAYQKYVKAPGTSFLQKLAAGLSNNASVFRFRYGSTSLASLYSYFFSEAADSAGRKGYSIVRLRLEDGEPAGRVWVSEKGTTYRVDHVRSQVLLQMDDTTLVAMRFPSAP